MNDTILAIFSALFGVLLTLGVTALINRLSYRNDYYKMIIHRRMDAYTTVETLANKLNTIAIDPNMGKPYHIAFCKGSSEAFEDIALTLLIAKDNSIWLSPEINSCLDELNQLICQITPVDDEQISIANGIEYYQPLSSCRIKMQECMKKDMMSIHKVKPFLKKAGL